MEVPLSIAGPCGVSPEHSEPILRALPYWFASAKARQHYVEQAAGLPTFLATVEGTAVAFLSLKQHGSSSAEIYTLAVRPEYHRQGIGRALVERAEAWCRERGVEYLQVKTVGPSRPNEAYAKTRAFLVAMGFRALEEFPTLWGKGNPGVIMVKRILQQTGMPLP